MDDNLPIPFTENPDPNPPKKNKGGRPKGSKNRSNYLLAQAQREIKQKFGLDNFDPVVFLMMTAADATQPMDIRIVAATKCAPYLHAPAKPAVVETTDKKKPVDLERLMSRVARDLLIENKVSMPTNEVEDEESESEDTEQN